MSDMQGNQEAKKISLLQQFIQQRDLFIQQSNELQMQYHQVQGAVFACNKMIAKIEQDAREQMEAIVKKAHEDIANKDNQGVNVDGEAHSEKTEQAA